MSDLGNVEIFVKNLKYYMNLNNKTRTDICNDLNLPYTTFAEWYNGKVYPRIDKIELLANYFSVKKSDLIEEKLKNTSNSAVVLVYGTIPAGVPMEMIEDVIDTEEIDANMLKGGKQTRYGEIKDFCPPIIDDVTFENTQRLLKKNARKPSAENSGGYIFQGLLRCAKCGYALSGKFYSKNVESSKYYYICKRHHLALKCTCNRNYNEHKIEEKLLSEFTPQLKKYIKDYEYKQENFKKLDLSKEISSLENKLTKLKDLYVRDLIRIEEYEKDYKTYIEQLESLSKEQERIKNNAPTDTDNIDKLKSILSQDFLKAYSLLSRTQKRRLWVSVIDYIVLDEDYSMKIFFI